MPCIILASVDALLADQPRTARVVRGIPPYSPTGAARCLWAVSPPCRGSSYVVSSPARPIGGEETMVFISDEHGEVLDWSDVSVVSGHDHDAAIRAAGYTVTP